MFKHRNHIAWLVITLVATVPQGCEKDNSPPQSENAIILASEEAIGGPDLEEIKVKGKLVALTLNTSTSYFIYRGHPMGFEYELLKRFAKDIDVELEIKLISDVNTMFEMLNRGEGDVIACNLAITQERQEEADFSEPYNFTKLVLVQRLPENHAELSQKQLNEKLILRPLELEGKRVFVNQSSPSYE
ncbi:MAG: transporter substrate-binding domain-containing protein, partial [Bacteroidota bacterium]